MNYIVLVFISLLTFVVPANVNAQDNEDITFEFLFQALDSLETSQQRNLQAQRIIRQARQTNESLHTEIEVLEQTLEQNEKNRNASILIICCGVIGWWLHKRKKK